MIDIASVEVEVIDLDISVDMSRAIHTMHYSPYVAIDIETSGLDHIHDRIATVQVYVPGYRTEIVRIREGHKPNGIIAVVEDYLPKKIFHYGMFDLSFMVQKWDISPNEIRDTRIAATILDPYKARYFNPTRQKKDHGLAALVWTYYQDRLDKELAISDWFGDLSPEQLSYASKDVIYLPYLLEQMISEMTVSQRANYQRSCQYLPTKVYNKVHNLPDPFERY